MIQNLLNIPSRTTEKNVTGMVKEGNEKRVLGEKEGLFKQLFEGLQTPGENDESEDKHSLDKSELPKEADSDSENSKFEGDSDEKVTLVASSKDMVEDLNQTNGKDKKDTDQGKFASMSDDLNTGSSQKIIPDQEIAVKDQNVSESNVNQSVKPVTGGQRVQGTIDEEGISGRSVNMTTQGLTNHAEAVPTDGAATTNGAKQDTESINTENRGSQVSDPVLQGPHNQDGTSANVDISTTTEVNGQKVSEEKREQISEKGVFNASPILAKDDLGLSSENAKNAQGSLKNGNETVKQTPNLKDIPVTGQATKTESEEAAALGNDNQVLNGNKLTESGNGIRLENTAAEQTLSGRVVAGQQPEAVLSSGPHGHTPQAVEFVQKAQAFAAENGQNNERNEAPVATLIRDELKTVDVNKPEVFGVSSEIKKAINQKDQDENVRSRLDVDKISMRADTDKRAPILGFENQQSGSNNQQTLKWGWTAGAQRFSSENVDDSVTFNNLKPDSTLMKDVDIADQKSTNYINLSSITISNISVKRNVLPGLTQAVLNSGTSKSSPESWNKHSFVLEDGSKIQLAARKMEGVIQLKIGSATPELNRLLQQHQSEIIEHLKKETELEVDLQFDDPKEESGFESFDDRNFATNSAATQGINRDKTGAVGAREYPKGRSIRTFGYNNMEWTA